jgi:hypothetical protein
MEKEMKKNFFWFIGAMVVGIVIGYSTTAHSQTEAPAVIKPATAPASVVAPVPVTKEVPAEQPVIAQDLVKDAEQMINNWKLLGSLAGLIALVQLLMKALKFGPLDNWFETSKVKWIKPYIATILGALLGGLTTYATNANLLNSITSGIIIGMGSVGWNEILKRFSAENRVA